MCDLRFTVIEEIRKLDPDQASQLWLEVLAMLDLDQQSKIRQLAKDSIECTHFVKNGEWCIVCGKHVPKEESNSGKLPKQDV